MMELTPEPSLIIPLRADQPRSVQAAFDTLGVVCDTLAAASRLIDRMPGNDQWVIRGGNDGLRQWEDGNPEIIPLPFVGVSQRGSSVAEKCYDAHPHRCLSRHPGRNNEVQCEATIKVVDRSEEVEEDGTIIQRERERFSSELTLVFASGQTAILH